MTERQETYNTDSPLFRRTVEIAKIRYDIAIQEKTLKTLRDKLSE